MSAPSPAARALAPLFSVLTPLFVAASILMALAWISGFGEATLAEPSVERAIPNKDLRAALALFSQGIDTVWVSLSAILAYLAVARAEGLATARYWCGVAAIVGFGVSAASAATGWPLGPVFFPINLGWKIGPVPFAIPLLWMALLIGSRELSLRLLPRAGHGLVALVSGVAFYLTFLNLDPLAWKYRAWWLWYPTPGTGANYAPWQCHLTWLVAGIGLAWLMRSPHVVPRPGIRPRTPLAVWAVLNGICIVTHLALRLR